jgi:SagB-type dehydrogenase family enzyme
MSEVSTLKNSDTRIAREYHEGTKHSELSIRMSGHYLDFQNKPKPFKVYTKLDSLPLPRVFPKPETNALTAIARTELVINGKKTKAVTVIDVATLSEILFFSAGLTRETKVGPETYYMRAASATGALYPIELYVICEDIPGLKGGVYHFNPAEFSLVQIRAGDFRYELSKAAGDNRNIASSPVTIAFTSLVWRNAWKYGTRSYRHWFWDSGVIAANLLATTISAGLESKLIIGFQDAKVNTLLGLNEARRKEAAIVLAPIGMGLGKFTLNQRDNNEPISPLDLEVIPLSEEEVDYPEIWKMHEGSYLSSEEEVKTWGRRGLSTTFAEVQPVINKFETRCIKAINYENDDKPTLSEVVLKRGSTRRFARSPVTFAQLSTVLHCSTQGVPVDFLNPRDTIVDIYFIANYVEDLQPGAYHFDRRDESLEELKRGQFRNISGYLCLEQQLFADASVVFFLITDLEKILEIFGNRGYRAAQFEAGVIAGKIYLSAYAQGIGASGSTFYDDAVTEFFSPYAEGKSTMIAVGIGVPDYRARPGKILIGKMSRTELLKQQ